MISYRIRRHSRIILMGAGILTLIALVFVVIQQEWLKAAMFSILGPFLIVQSLTWRLMIYQNVVVQEILMFVIKYDLNNIEKIYYGRKNFVKVLVLSKTTGEKSEIPVFSFEKTSSILFEIYKRLPNPTEVKIADEMVAVIKEEQMLEGADRTVVLERRHARKKEAGKKALKISFGAATFAAFLYMAGLIILSVIRQESIQPEQIFLMIWLVILCYFFFMPVVFLALYTLRPDEYCD